jgi:dipeptidyl aminopeptidase/acylaminoacyl peptidase
LSRYRNRGAQRGTVFSLLLAACLASWPFAASAQAPATPAVPLTLEDLFAEDTVIDASISPSGKSLAATVRRQNEDAIILVDLVTGEKKLVTRINKDAYGDQLDVRMGYVFWKTDERLLFQLRSDTNEGVEINRLSRANIFKLGKRLYAVDRDGKNLTALLISQPNEELTGAFDTSNIASLLRKDPSHILLRVGGWEGRTLFKVNVTTGAGKIVEHQSEKIVDWWLDVDGNAVVREEYFAGTRSFYRKLDNNRWKKYFSMRRGELDELEEMTLIGPSQDPDKFFVLARPPDRDRIGLYLYELANEKFGEPLIEHPKFDLDSARATDDGGRVLYYCYTEHVRHCESSDPKMNLHLSGLRKFFDESANVYIRDASDNGNAMLLYVGGPSEPPAYYYYLVDQKKVEFVGFGKGALSRKALPTSQVVTYKTRDGQEQTGYLTYPPGAKGQKNLPLVLMPHGGPQVRDRLEFHPWVQYLAARGYAVFQPNFRGSGGFGKAYELSGHREWGRKMQDDLGDGVKALVDQGIVDPARICIFGASYGGYAALAGAAFTPDAYKCAVSLAGVADLEAFVRYKKRKYGADSYVVDHYTKKLGDADKDQALLRAASPQFHVNAIKIPVLLIHGVEDDNVPISQSEDMQKAMEKAGKKTPLLRLEDEGHGGFSDDSYKVMLSTVGDFLWQQLGPGFNTSSPPDKYTFVKKKGT